MTVKCVKDTEHEAINKEIEDNILRLIGNINIVKDESCGLEEDDELDMEMQSILLDALNDSYTGDYTEQMDNTDNDLHKEVLDSKADKEDEVSDAVIKNIKMEQAFLNEQSDMLKAEFLVKYKNIENDFIKASELYDKVDYKNIKVDDKQQNDIHKNVAKDTIDILEKRVVYKNIAVADTDEPKKEESEEKAVDKVKALKQDANEVNEAKTADKADKVVEEAKNINQNISEKVSFLLDNIKPEVLKELEEDVKKECAYESVDSVTRVDDEDLSKEELHKQILEDIKQSRIRIKEQKKREEELKAKAMECINSMKLEETDAASNEKELDDLVIEKLNDKRNYEKFYKMIKGLRVNAPNKKVMGIVAGMLAIMVVIMMVVTGVVTASPFN